MILDEIIADFPGLKILDKSPNRSSNIYFHNTLILICWNNKDKFFFAKPQSMSIKKKFAVNDEVGIKKFFEDIWIENYLMLSKND